MKIVTDFLDLTLVYLQILGKGTPEAAAISTKDSTPKTNPMCLPNILTLSLTPKLDLV